MEKSSSQKGYLVENVTYDPKLAILFISITIICILGFLYGIFLLYSGSISSGTSFYMGIIFTLMLAIIKIYFIGAIYTEISAKNDFIRIFTDGVEYQSSPKFFHGWLTTRGKIPFKEIKKVQILQFATMLDLTNQYETKGDVQFDMQQFLNKSIALGIVLKNDKMKMIGERLDPKKLFQAAVFIESGAMIGQTLAKIAEKYPTFATTVSNVLSGVKKIFQRQNE